MEIWKDVEGYEGLYSVSNEGRVKRLVRRTGPVRAFLKLFKSWSTYYTVDLCKDNVVKRTSVHRLVAAAFIPNPKNKPQVNHKNGIKDDNRVENLEWVSHRENAIHAMKHGLHPVAYDKVMTADRREIVFELYSKGVRQYQIGLALNVNQSVISRVLNRKNKYSINN